MRNKRPIPTTKAWFSKLDKLNSGPFMNMDVSNLALSSAAKCFVPHLLTQANDHMTEGSNDFSAPSMQHLPY
jgi:hypothetical protein